MAFFVWKFGSQKVKRTYNLGLGKYLNSSLPFGQVTLKFCLPGALTRLPRLNSLINHEPKKWKSFTCMFECNKPFWIACNLLCFDHFHVRVLACYFLNYALGIFKNRWVRLLKCKRASCLTPKKIILKHVKLIFNK